MGKVTTYTYNEIGKVESVTDSLNHRTEFTYNSRGQNTAVRDAANNTSSATYDLLGNVTRLAGPLGGATCYNYDCMGRLISETTASGGRVQYTYNALSVRDTITNARGQVRNISYDVMGRITGYTAPEGAVSYTYDANGNVLTVTDSHGTITRTYDALNRVKSYTDTYGKTIRYDYDSVGNLTRIIYPDYTSVKYVYDANHNLARVVDWADRETTYYYDENNRVIRVIKPDGSETTTAYDNAQRLISTVERTASGTVITGFEYTYDDLSRIIEEKVLANSTKMCYTYDSLNRVTKRTVKNFSNAVLSEETFTYDAAGNITDAPDSCFAYDTNNRLTAFMGEAVIYDPDGNMLWNGELACTYDSANRLITAGGHTYTYNAENVRIRNLCADADTTYTYNTNCKLSQLLVKTTNGIVTKYVYGRGLIGEEKQNCDFKTYHFDYRGSTVAITDIDGNITDTFKYDTYGKLIDRTGTSFVIFGYNGRDGVVTDKNGLIYMRARYYSPDMRRFVNADIVAGELSNAVTLNRFAYANGNPVSFVDPFGLAADDRSNSVSDETIAEIEKIFEGIASPSQAYDAYVSILNLILTTTDLYSISYENELQLIKTIDYEVNFKTKINVGDGPINYDVSKVIKLVNAKNYMEFWDETDILKLDLASVSSEIVFDDYNKFAVSLDCKYNALFNSFVVTGSFTRTYSNEYGDYISNTLELKSKIRNYTKTNGEKTETEESKKPVSVLDPSKVFASDIPPIPVFPLDEFSNGESGYTMGAPVGAGVSVGFAVCCAIFAGCVGGVLLNTCMPVT